MKLNLANLKEVVFIATKVGERTVGAQASNGFQDTKVPVYYMSVDAEGDVGSLPCTIDVFNFLNQVDKYTAVNIAITFDTWKKDFIVTNVALAKKKD